jgi:hypothetical protein
MVLLVARRYVCFVRNCCLFRGAPINVRFPLQRAKSLAGTGDTEGTSTTKKPPKKSKAKVKSVDGVNPDNGIQTQKKPRIKIKLAACKPEVESNETDSKEHSKRKREDSDTESLEPDTISTPIPKKRKKASDPATKSKKGKPKLDTLPESSDDNRPLQEVASRKTRAAGPKDQDDNKSLYLDMQFWKKCREALNGTYKAARKNLTQHTDGSSRQKFRTTSLPTLQTIRSTR